jgi:condensin complex subunit 1
LFFIALETSGITERATTVTAADKPVDKDNNDLDAVAGNAEDDIGDLIASIREKELLYGEDSLLAVYGPLVAHIAEPRNPYKVCVMKRFCETN